MRRAGTLVIVLVTAIISAAVTSAFWLVAFNAGALTARKAEPPPAPAEPRDPPAADPTVTVSPGPSNGPGNGGGGGGGQVGPGLPDPVTRPPGRGRGRP